MKHNVFVLWLGPLLALSGCATIVNGSTQTLSVQTSAGDTPLASAQCTLANKKGSWTVTTPGPVTVHRGSEALDVTCARPGYLSAAETVKSEISGYVYGNILLGGGFGATVDTVNGAAWQYPASITIPMQPATGIPVAAN
jgi:hypothetical protein